MSSCRTFDTVISQISMLEVLRRRGLLREQMHQVSETRREWMPMYDFEVLVMYRVLVLYTFMQEDGVLNYVDVQTGAAPPLLAPYACALVHARFAPHQLWFYSGWQDCKVALRDDRDYAQQAQVVESWLGLDVARHRLQSMFRCDFGVAGLPRLLLDVCYHPDMLLWHEDPSSVYQITFTNRTHTIWNTRRLTYDEMLTPQLLADVPANPPLLATLHIRHLAPNQTVYREAVVDLQRGHACIRGHQGRLLRQFTVELRHGQ